MSNLIFNKQDWQQLIEEINPSSMVVLSDQNTSKHCLPYFTDQYLGEVDFYHLEIPAGESSKELKVTDWLWSRMQEAGIDRKSLLIALGGGVVTDIGGFVASTYKRGIQHVLVPTTTLAMTDAALGGKTGINFNGLKNQIGTFYNAASILVDLQFLSTLPENEMRSGWMETVKHALIADADLWNHIRHSNWIDMSISGDIIGKSAAIKMNIAEQDQTDLGVRQALNFGHTVGHAIESSSGLLHGEAIAFGMVAESYLSSTLLGLDQRELDDIVHYIEGLGISFTDLDLNSESILANIMHDKKNENGRLIFALISNIGKAEVNVEVDAQDIEKAITFAADRLIG